MRPDMAKVIVERPRYGSRDKTHKGLRRRSQRTPLDEAPRRDRMPGRIVRTRRLNEHLGPLRRYLVSNVGRPWDKVFAEICAHISRDSAVQDHMRDHVDDYVETHTILINGIPCSSDGRRYGRPLSQFFWRQLYVCPRTGLLKKIKNTWKRSVKAARQLTSFVKAGDGEQYHRLDGAVYLVSLKPLPFNHQSVMNHTLDVVLNQKLWQLPEAILVQAYGGRFYAVAKRRLGKKELKQTPVPVEWWR